MSVPKYLQSAIIFAFIFFFINCLQAQDVHYSQVGNSPSTLNPGLVGVFNGNGRFIANFRNQWQAVPVPYLQLAAAYDHRFTKANEQPTPYAASFNFNHDRAGDLGLSLTTFAASGSYSLRLQKDKQHFLSAGLSIGINQRRFDPAEATLDEQYDFKGGVNLGIPISETFATTSKWYSTFAVGGNIRLQSDKKRNKVDFGLGIFNFNEPDKSFEDGPPIRHEPRLSIHGNAALEVSEKLDVLFFGTGQLQGEYNEAVFGAGVMGYLNTQKTKELALQVGLLHRINDAIIPWIGVHWSAWQFHVSFDTNTSQFRQVTDFRGGPEVTVIYIFKNVPVMEYCKLCPKYM